MNYALHIALATFVASATSLAAAPEIKCRKTDDPAVLLDIESKKDAVLFRYYPSELVNEFSVEYLNCRTNASISVEMPSNFEVDVQKVRNVIKRAIESPVKYTRPQVIDAIQKAGFSARPGELDNSVCACDATILKKAAKRWN